MAKQVIDSFQRGARIKMLREEKKLTQDSLAQLLGIDKSTFNRYEHGTTRRINESVLKSMAQLLDTTYEYLQFGKGLPHPEKSRTVPSFLLDDSDTSLNSPLFSYDKRNAFDRRADAAVEIFRQSSLADMADRLESIADGFNVIVEETAMAPRINKGDELAVLPCSRLEPGKVNVFINAEGTVLIRDVGFQDGTYIIKTRDGRELQIIKSENVKSHIKKVLGYCIGLRIIDI